MEKRTLGHSDLQIAPLAFGGNVFGWTVDEAMSFKLLDAFVSAGFNLIDTADIYSRWHPSNQGGESETIIGNWIKKSGRRNDVIIATKVGMEMGAGQKGLSKNYIFKSVDSSLKRLQVDHIDLYQAHEDDPNTPLEETLDAFSQLIKQGKVRAIGASNYKMERLAKALHVSEENGLARYESLQPEYNLYSRSGYEEGLETLCQQKELGVINYFALARGFLSGKYSSEADLSKSVRGEGIKQQYFNERGFRIIKALNQVAKSYSAKPAQVAIAWLIARPSITAPIASATNLDQLHDLIQSANLQLDPSDVSLLNHASEYSTADSLL